MATNEGTDVRPEVETNSSPSEYNSETVNGSPSTCNSGGSVFSSPKVLTGAGNNPFAVRSSPGRVSNDSNSGDIPNHSPASIIAPSKFGASASSSCNSSNSAQAATGVCLSSSTSHPFKESHDGADFNGPSSKPLLRPSLIGSGSGSSFASSGTSLNHSILKPATLGNPFSRAVELAGDDSSTTTVQQPVFQRNLGTDTAESKPTLLIPSRLNSVSAVGSSPTAPAAASEGSDEGSELGGTSVTPDLAPTESVVPSAIPRPSLTPGSLFSTIVTSVTSVATTPTPATPTACANFVFGQKLHERVANPNHTSTEPTSNGAESTTNLFTVIPKEKSESEAASTNGMAASKTLSDSARELEEARAAKRKYDEVTVVTGEEDEQNALQVYGKLFTFDKVQGTWIERGRGTLRLNDKQLDNHALQSRLVMRTQGCLRVILNTKIWAEMTIDKTSSKSIRMTAVDGDQIRVFLLMASLKDTETLFNALEWRLATLRAHQSRVAATSSSIPDVDSSAAFPAVPHNEDGTSSPKRRALPVESEELGDETKKKRSE
uniref:EOG090X078K n=1 Tax=Daphnia similis TaxID=35528 RepID=A0A4Y7LT89_9CRUS|nr:EOG090X078K [Daphnia similis]SVE71082.1 EOG090X078K [Daphnia similis]SVE71713.1 EOG090X078K [Daphnia similis]SVE72343.1 EOG090X078K [Daphnia similis]